MLIPAFSLHCASRILSTSPPQLAISTARYVPMTTVPRRTATRRSVYIPTRCSVSRQAERLGGTVTDAVDTPPFITTPLTSTEADKPGRAKGGKAHHFGRHSHL